MLVDTLSEGYKWGKRKGERRKRTLGLGASKLCGKKLPACGAKLFLLKEKSSTSQANRWLGSRMNVAELGFRKKLAVNF